MVSVNAEEGHPKLGTLFLAYDVAPYATYPRQLSQAVAVMKYVMEELSIAPPRILIAGDSAGANLCLEVLSHALHSHPSPIVQKLELKEKLKGALLICPWVDFRHDSAGFQRNRYKDAIGKKTLDRWAKHFLGSAEADGYNQPLRAPSGWYQRLGDILTDVKILGGGDEVMIDDILAFAKILEEEWSREKVTVEVIPGECHDSFMLDRMLGYRPEDLAMHRAVKEWAYSKSD
jgi:acetyl esterase/lipase